MPSATTALRSTLRRPWILATLTAIAVASLLSAGSFALIKHALEQSESEQMNARGERFIDRLEQIFGQLREGVDQLSTQASRRCDAQMQAALNQVGADYRFVFEAAFVEGSESCSSRPGRTAADLVRAPDIVGPTYSYWLNTSAEPNDNLAVLMLGRGEFRVSTSRGHLTDVVDLSDNASLLVLLDKGQRAVPVLGPPQAWPPAADWPPASGEALTVTPERLIYRMTTKSPDYQLVLISPRINLMAQLNSPLWLLFPASLLIAFISGWGVLTLVRQRRTLNGELQGALRRGEIRVLYQPIFDLGSRRCVGAEALVRWRRPDGSLTSPDLFIPLAENTGMIREITDFVFQQLLQQLGQVLRANPQLYISVNLAACDVIEPRVGEVVGRLLALHGVAPQQIAFEVTERGLIDVVPARENLQSLRALGHKVLIDDFGTGYCSLAYLQTLPVDCLKIDKAFIDALGHDAASSGVAPHIIRMAHALDLTVIAEGIESEAQAVLLNSEGVNYGQGWLFAHALNWRQFSELVTRGRRKKAGRRVEDEAGLI